LVGSSSNAGANTEKTVEKLYSGTGLHTRGDRRRLIRRASRGSEKKWKPVRLWGRVDIFRPKGERRPAEERGARREMSLAKGDRPFLNSGRRNSSTAEGSPRSAGYSREREERTHTIDKRSSDRYPAMESCMGWGWVFGGGRGLVVGFGLGVLERTRIAGRWNAAPNTSKLNFYDIVPRERLNP